MMKKRVGKAELMDNRVGEDVRRLRRTKLNEERVEEEGAV